jgi:hypothetical protein
VEDFRLVGEIVDQETIAEASGIRELPRLVKAYGRANWRKRKGRGTIEVAGGQIRQAELHWYEAHGIGRKELKIKRFVD